MKTLVDQVIARCGQSDKVKIKNVDKTEKLLQTIVSSGLEHLQVITDFDHTLTRSHLNGKLCDSSHGIIANSPLVPDTLKSDIWELYGKYSPVVLDVTLSKEEKDPLMIEWSKKSQNRFLMSKPKLKQSMIADMIRDKNSKCMMRDNASKLLGTLHKHEIPVLILSAGIGNLVEEVLRFNSVLYPNMKIIANFMQFDEDGKLKSFSEPVIHIFNKNEAALHDDHSSYFEDLESRHIVILMGDSLGDTNMHKGVKDPKAVLKIGFLNSNTDENLSAYMDSYDVILVDDQSLDFVNSLMDLVIKP